MKNIILYGRQGSGKSMLLQKLRVDYSATQWKPWIKFEEFCPVGDNDLRPICIEVEDVMAYLAPSLYQNSKMLPTVLDFCLNQRLWGRPVVVALQSSFTIKSLPPGTIVIKPSGQYFQTEQLHEHLPDLFKSGQ